jgi:hypothetical protein
MLSLRRGWFGLVAVAAGLLLAPLPSGRSEGLARDTEWVFTINVKQIMDSDLVKANKENLTASGPGQEWLPAGDDGAESSQAAGFDPGKDLVRSSPGRPGWRRTWLLIVVEGRFNVDKVHAADDAYARRTPSRSARWAACVYEVSVPGEKTAFISLVDNKTLVATASKESLAGAINRISVGKKANLSASSPPCCRP